MKKISIISARTQQQKSSKKEFHLTFTSWDKINRQTEINLKKPKRAFYCWKTFFLKIFFFRSHTQRKLFF